MNRDALRQHSATATLDRTRPSYIGGMLEMANTRMDFEALTDGLRTGAGMRSRPAATGRDSLCRPEKVGEVPQAMTDLSVGTAGDREEISLEEVLSFVVGCAQGGVAADRARAQAPGGADRCRWYLRGLCKSRGVQKRVQFHVSSRSLPSADVIVMGHLTVDGREADAPAQGLKRFRPGVIEMWSRSSTMRGLNAFDTLLVSAC
ncbi:MAG: hypothetical protein U0231_03080 [Nitrospiraceae bacterium]